MKVHLVFYGNKVNGVFESHEIAVEKIREENAKKPKQAKLYEIKEIELNKWGSYDIY